MSEKEAKKILMESHYYRENILRCNECKIILDNSPSKKEPFYVFRIYISHKDNDEVVSFISVNAYTGRLHDDILDVDVN